MTKQDPLRSERLTEEEQILRISLYANAFPPSNEGREQEETLTEKIGAAKWKTKVVILERGVIFQREVFWVCSKRMHLFFFARGNAADTQLLALCDPKITDGGYPRRIFLRDFGSGMELTANMSAADGLCPKLVVRLCETISVGAHSIVVCHYYNCQRVSRSKALGSCHVR